MYPCVSHCSIDAVKILKNIKKIERAGGFVDGGNPVSAVKTIAPDGSLSDGGVNPSTGYSILKADSLDAAVTLAKGCPIIAGGGSVEVAETFAAM